MLRRNGDLRRLGGTDHAEDVPQPWNMSRFLAVLGREPFCSLLQEVFDQLVERLGGAGIGNVVYDEAGTLYCSWSFPLACFRPVAGGDAGPPPRKRAMLNVWRVGVLADRGEEGSKEKTMLYCYDIPRATKKFERLYKGRSAVERVNARLKVFWGVDDGNVGGGASFHANVGVVMLVHIGLATLLAKAPRRDPKRRLGQTRLSPVARALHGR